MIILAKETAHSNFSYEYFNLTVPHRSLLYFFELWGRMAHGEFTACSCSWCQGRAAALWPHHLQRWWRCMHWQLHRWDDIHCHFVASIGGRMNCGWWAGDWSQAQPRPQRSAGDWFKVWARPTSQWGRLSGWSSGGTWSSIFNAHQHHWGERASILQPGSIGKAPQCVPGWTFKLVVVSSMGPSHHPSLSTDSMRLFPRSIRLRSASYLKTAVESMLQLLFSDYSTVKVASASTLSRARRKIDVAMMFLRRQQLSDVGIKNLSLQLSFLTTDRWPHATVQVLINLCHLIP